VLQHAESEFDAIPFGVEAARVYGRVIAATAIAEELPLFTTNPGDFDGLRSLLMVVPVTRPTVVTVPR
jgi:predicted nucleic acid-binding protein